MEMEETFALTIPLLTLLDDLLRLRNDLSLTSIGSLVGVGL